MKIKVLAFNVYVKASKGAVSFCYVEASAAVRYFKKMTVCCQHFCIRGSSEKLSQDKVGFTETTSWIPLFQTIGPFGEIVLPADCSPCFSTN